MEGTIHTYDRQWANAEIIEEGKVDRSKTLRVRHPDFNEVMQFWKKPDSRGRHFNVGNAAFWLTK